jgi:adenylate kinase family enzyme
MTRISVVGCTGAGKTTVAAKLADALDIPHIELDALHWGPDWDAATSEEMIDRVGSVISGDAWVVDGNYQSKIGNLVWKRADAVVWVDPPRWRVMVQVLRRTAIRAAAGEELWNGNRESLRGLMFWRGDDSILWYAWSSYPRTRARYRNAMSDTCFANLAWHRLRTRRDADDLVRAMAMGE